MKVKKTCIVCGKSFLAANPLYCLCSNECRAKRKLVYKNRYEKTHAKAIKEQRKKRNIKYYEQHKKKSYCKICGMPLSHGNQKYCLKCLLKTYQNEKTRSWAYAVLRCRGYDKETIISEIEERQKMTDLERLAKEAADYGMSYGEYVAWKARVTIEQQQNYCRARQVAELNRKRGHRKRVKKELQ